MDERKSIVESGNKNIRLVSKLSMTLPVYSSICLFIYNLMDKWTKKMLMFHVLGSARARADETDRIGVRLQALGFRH